MNLQVGMRNGLGDISDVSLRRTLAHWCDNWQLYIKTGYYSNTLVGLQESKEGGQIKIQVTA